MAKKAASKSQKPTAEQTVIDSIRRIVDEFCRTHLNEEYRITCLALTDKLARKRPSPLLSGQPNSWASGIIRTIGWVNFLDDRSQTPHMKSTDVDKALGVSEATGQSKSKRIRDLLNVGRFDIDWTLPSRCEDNPLMWLLSVNGILMDIRHCPREAQEIAFERGLIPYIPADQS